LFNKYKKKSHEIFLKEVEGKYNDEYEILDIYTNAHTKIKIKHKICNNIFEITPSHFLKDNRECPICRDLLKLKKNEDIFKKKVFDLVGDEYTILGKYINVNTLIKMIHNKCNHIYEVRPMDFIKLNGNRCPKCFGKNKITTEQFKQEVFSLVGDEYTVLGEYINNNTPVKMIHNKCNHIYEINRQNFVNTNHRCLNCSKNKRITTEEFKQEVFDLVADEYTVLGEYKNTNTPIEIIHNKCNHEFKVKPNNFKNGTRCPNCFGNLKLDISQFKQDVFNLVGDEYTVLGEYINSKTKIKLMHNKCKYIYDVRPNDFKNGNRCPKCFASISTLETNLSDFISNIYSKKIIFNNKNIIKPYEIDIYLPEENIAFEFNGLYWHSEEGSSYKCNKDYHLNKTLACQKKEIQLIHIFEDEWLNNEIIVKSKIKHILGLNNGNKIYARKCYIKEVNNKIKEEFLNSNHIQGNDKSILNLGLYYKDKLLSIMTFCNLRKALGQRSKENCYELSRFAVDINYQVPGAFSKIWSYFVNNYEFNEIITYADRRWSIGSLYETCEFKLDHISKPNYWYTDKKKRYHRFNYRKGNLKKLFPDIYDDNKTEKEIMKEVGYFRIWDCGNLVYKYIN
jgi:hypothetical protein